MKYKIGVYGSNVVESEETVYCAQELGRSLAQQNVIVVTGACSGMPYIIARAAKRQGAEIWGFAPARTREEQQIAFPNDDIRIYDRLFFIPPHYDQHFFFEQPLEANRDWPVRLKYRNFLSTSHVDAAIIVAGGWGTLNEFTNLLYEAKAIGVLIGTGGIADELPSLYMRLRKKSESIVQFHRSPVELVTNLLHALSSPKRE